MGPDEAHQRAAMREDGHDGRAPFNLLVQALERVGAVEARPVLTREVAMGEDGP
jgi:hypothetical protein